MECRKNNKKTSRRLSAVDTANNQSTVAMPGDGDPGNKAVERYRQAKSPVIDDAMRARTMGISGHEFGS